MKYRPLDMFVKQTDDLKELITQYPDYPIVVIVANEVVDDDYYGWWYAPCLSFDIGEILDCEQDIDEEKTYVDRDDFEEDVQYNVECDENFENVTDEEFDAEVKRIMTEYEPYWRKVIQIRADV